MPGNEPACRPGKQGNSPIWDGPGRRAARKPACAQVWRCRASQAAALFGEGFLGDQVGVDGLRQAGLANDGVRRAGSDAHRRRSGLVGGYRPPVPACNAAQADSRQRLKRDQHARQLGGRKGARSATSVREQSAVVAARQGEVPMGGRAPAKGMRPRTAPPRAARRPHGPPGAALPVNRGGERSGAQPQTWRSKERYWMASETWSAVRVAEPARSAIVRATLRMRS